MKYILITLLLAVIFSESFAQTILNVNGQTFSNSSTGTYGGYNVPRSTVTTFTFTNNLFTTVSDGGYQLCAGDEVAQSTNNHLDGAVITGNKFIWNGTDPTSDTHILFTGYNKDVVIKYNYLYRAPNGIPRKASGMHNTSGGVAYNILVDPTVGVVAKGMNDVRIFNNTFYSEKSISDTWRGLIDIYINNDEGQYAPSTNTKIFNNIFYTTKQRVNIYVYETECLAGFESDYNVYYCESGGPRFQIGGNIYNLSQWQSLGYDVHSVVVNPNFIDRVNFVPASRLDYGTDLGSEFQSGLATDAVWGTTSPATASQNGTWQVGARIYGSSPIHVTGITVTGAGGSAAIATNGGTLQLSAAVLPADATNKTVVWSVINGTGQATINSSTGLVTALANGTVTARATATDGSGVYGSLVITISNQGALVTGITVTGAGGATSISAHNGTLQLSAAVQPANAANQTVTWSISNGTGTATIGSSGLVTALSDGTVTATASATDGSGVTGSLVITITNQTTPVTSITVTGAGGSASISTDNGTLQLSAAVLPADASNKNVLWSVTSGTGQATISGSGLVTALANGTVTARATAQDGSGVYGTLLLTISNQQVPVTGITVAGTGGATIITTNNGTLQLTATVLPVNATNNTVTWTLVNGSGQATINTSGLVTAVADGNVTAIATANDGTGISGSLVITISSQIIAVTGITVTGAGGASAITADNGTLQLNASILPANATNKNVTWSVGGGTGGANISSTGLLTAIANGTVIAMATASDGSGVTGTLLLTISNQVVKVSSISVTGEGGATAIFNDNATLQLYAAVLPDYATLKTVSWKIEGITGEATISTTGLVTAVSNGTVTATASANDGSGIYGTLLITISGQIIPVSGITVTGEGGINTISSAGGSLQLNAEVLPENATNRLVSWTISEGSVQATISDAGMVTAIGTGTVTAMARATDGSGVSGSMNISIVYDGEKLYSVVVSTDEIRITFYEDFTSWAADLYDFRGHHVQRKIVDSNVVSFSRRSVSSGLYLVVLSKGEQLYVEKVMVY
jgi:uncharacterized protein YjdB